MRVTSTRPGGDALLELVGRRDRAGLEQRVDLLRDRLADAGELLGAALLGHLGDGDARLADRLGGVAVGDDAVDDRAVELVEAGELVEGLGDLGVPHVVTRLRAALPGAWLILPTYNEAENIEAIVRAALPQLASTGLRAHDPGRRRQLARRHRRDRRPAGRRASRRSRCCTAPRKEGLGRAYLAGFADALGGRRRAGARDGLRLLPRPRRPAAPDRRGRTPPTWCSARATCPAAASQTGARCGGSCRAAARCTRACSSACRCAT